MAVILRPRRARKEVAESENIVLRKGEIFFEMPNDGVDTDHYGNIKMGDGVTHYNDLPYYFYGNKTNPLTAEQKAKLDSVETGANKTIIVNNLTSDSTTSALSAKQGKELNTLILNAVTKATVTSALGYTPSKEGIVLTQAQYDDLATKDPTIPYYIVEG